MWWSPFSGDSPAVVFLEAPTPEAVRPKYVKPRLKAVVTKFFSDTSVVGAVVIASDVTKSLPGGGVGITRSYEYERNPSARHPLPSAAGYFSP